MNKRAAVAVLSIMASLLSGCSNTRILERVGFIHTLAYDQVEEGQYKITASIPRAQVNAPASREVLTATGKSSKEGKIKMNLQTSLHLVNGQLRDIIISTVFAQEGILGQIDTLLRDPNISPQIKIVLVNGNAEALLSKDYKQHPDTDKYIDRLLKKEAASHSVPKTTLYMFERDLLDDGIDASAPIIKEKDDYVTIDGIGLFQDDRYVMRIVPNDAMIFAMLYDSFKEGELNLELGDGEEKEEIVMFNSLSSKRKVHISKQESGKTSAVIEINIRGSIKEYLGEKKLSQDADRKQLTKQIEERLTARAEALVKRMQNKKTDPIGIGQHVRNHMNYHAWKQLDWSEEFPKIDVKCKVHFGIKDFGKFR